MWHSYTLDYHRHPSFLLPDTGRTWSRERPRRAGDSHRRSRELRRSRSSTASCSRRCSFRSPSQRRLRGDAWRGRRDPWSAGEGDIAAGDGWSWRPSRNSASASLCEMGGAKLLTSRVVPSGNMISMRWVAVSEKHEFQKMSMFDWSFFQSRSRKQKPAFSITQPRIGMFLE